MAKVRLDLHLPHDAELEPDVLRREVASALGIPESKVLRAEITRRALDARRKMRTPLWHLTVDAELEGKTSSNRSPAKGSAHRPSSTNVREVPAPSPRLDSPRVSPSGGPVIVVGAGPAGLFAAWHLAEHGAKVVLVERGKPVERRARDFGAFRGRGILDPESNLCFGEGGAGTYSDGKLTTRKHDPLVREVLERFAEVGAPPRILVDAKPHIGTNLLFRMLIRLRERLLSLGVEIRFETKVERLSIGHGRVVGADLAPGGQLDGRCVVLATGHSARDTFEALFAQGIPMVAKPFAVGVRAEHPQQIIDSAQYRVGPPRPVTLPPADYRLTHQEGGRGVYSFCMCPGGMIVPTATEPGMVVVNGMSTARRSSPFANSGIVVQVEVSDLEAHGFGSGALAGVEFQRALERAAFASGAGGYRAPAMLASDLVKGVASGSLAKTHFRPGLTPSDLRDVLPAFIMGPIARSLVRFDQIIRGYTSSEANLIAVESRTSSPLQIPRDPDTLTVPGFPGLFVAGEGPGYAGGITSAAMDGLRVAHAALSSFTG